MYILEAFAFVIFAVNCLADTSSLHKLLNTVPPLCDTTYLRGTVDSIFLEVLASDSHTSQAWSTPWPYRPKVIAASGKFSSESGCNWFFYEYVLIEDLQEIRLHPAIVNGNNIALAHMLPKQLPYPFSYMRNVLFLVAKDEDFHNILPYGIDVTTTTFVPLPSLGFPVRSNFLGSKLVWGFTRVFLIPDSLLLLYTETRETMNHLAGLLLDVTHALNATVAVEKISYYGDIKESMTVHLLPPIPFTGETVKLGIPLDAGVWDSVKAFIRLPHVLKSSRHFNIIKFVREPIVPMLIGISAVVLACIMAFPLPLDKFPTLVGIAFLIFHLYINQPLPSALLRDGAARSAAKFACLPYLLGAVTLVSLQQTQFLTDMTAATVHNPPRNLPELLESDYNLTFYGLDDGAAGKMVRHMGMLGHTAATKLMQKGVHGVPLDGRRDCMYQMVTHEKQSCIGGYLPGYSAGMGIFAKGGIGKKRFDTTTDSVVPFLLGFVINRRLPHITDCVRKIVVAHLQCGLNYMLHPETWLGNTDESTDSPLLRPSRNYPQDNGGMMMKECVYFFLKVLSTLVLVLIVELLVHVVLLWIHLNAVLTSINMLGSIGY